MITIIPAWIDEHRSCAFCRGPMTGRRGETCGDVCRKRMSRWRRGESTRAPEQAAPVGEASAGIVAASESELDVRPSWLSRPDRYHAFRLVEAIWARPDHSKEDVEGIAQVLIQRAVRGLKRRVEEKPAYEARRRAAAQALLEAIIESAGGGCPTGHVDTAEFYVRREAQRMKKKAEEVDDE